MAGAILALLYFALKLVTLHGDVYASYTLASLFLHAWYVIGAAFASAEVGANFITSVPILTKYGRARFGKSGNVIGLYAGIYASVIVNWQGAVAKSCQIAGSYLLLQAATMGEAGPMWSEFHLGYGAALTVFGIAFGYLKTK